MLFTPPQPPFLEIVQAESGETGRYIGNGMVLFIDGENNMSWGKLKRSGRPQPGVLLPTKNECEAAAMMYHIGLHDGLRGTGRA